MGEDEGWGGVRKEQHRRGDQKQCRRNQICRTAKRIVRRGSPSPVDPSRPPFSFAPAPVYVELEGLEAEEDPIDVASDAASISSEDIVATLHRRARISGESQSSLCPQAPRNTKTIRVEWEVWEKETQGRDGATRKNTRPHRYHFSLHKLAVRFVEVGKVRVPQRLLGGDAKLVVDDQ